MAICQKSTRSLSGAERRAASGILLKHDAARLVEAEARRSQNATRPQCEAAVLSRDSMCGCGYHITSHLDVSILSLLDKNLNILIV